MTTIKTTCGRCGDIHLTPDDVALELHPGGQEGDYRFKCPSCTEQQRRPANSRVVSVLLATGVAFVVINPEPITESEIAAFADALESEPDLFRLLAG
ncbi:MAG: hypothetical protein OEM39_03840 [Acidimicrobiia bacterium]|nr:hypothetical protein [Acidimicrobiia bacterium]